MKPIGGPRARDLIASLLRHGQKFQYQPLPSPTSLRLLRIENDTSRRDEDIRLVLDTFEFEKAPEFSALSYTWGSPSSPHSTAAPSDSLRRISLLQRIATQNPYLVSIDGVHAFGGQIPDELTRCFPIDCNGSVMHVTANLNDSLKMLASGLVERPNYIWIDALCIDQENIIERNEQVKQMSRIFKASQGTIIWLGEGDEFCDDAFEVINRISQIPASTWSTVPYTGFYHPEECYTQLGIDALSYRNWLGYLGFISRPWFRRAWVVQELALSQKATVVCGQRTLPWSKISKTLNFIKATRWYHHLDTEKIKHIKELRRNPGIYGKFLSKKVRFDLTPLYLDRTREAMQESGTRLSSKLRMLMDSHRQSNATDPRDKVFAFLGLADRKKAPFLGTPNYIKPDYARSVQQVFADASRSMLLSDKNLDLLSHVQDASATKIAGLPSWVPDYSVSLWPYPLRFRGACNWSAAMQFPWKPSIASLENDKLEVQGIILDTIDATALLPKEKVKAKHSKPETSEVSDNTNPPTTASWKSIIDLALSTPPQYVETSKSGDTFTRFEALWRTLITNTYARKHPAPLVAGEHFVEYITNIQLRQRLAPWPNHLDFQAHHELTSDEVEDPGWRKLFEAEPENSRYSLESFRNRFTTIMEQVFEGGYTPIGLAQLQHEIEASSRNARRLFKTTGNLLGVGPRSLRAEDEVWILAGANVPFVLRKREGEDGTARTLVGETYVHGIMHGGPARFGKEQVSAVIY